MDSGHAETATVPTGAPTVEAVVFLPAAAPWPVPVGTLLLPVRLVSSRRIGVERRSAGLSRSGQRGHGTCLPDRSKLHVYMETVDIEIEIPGVRGISREKQTGEQIPKKKKNPPTKRAPHRVNQDPFGALENANEYSATSTEEYPKANSDLRRKSSDQQLE